MSYILLYLSLALISNVGGDMPLWQQEFEDFKFVSEMGLRNSENIYRLPRNVVPVEYEIYLDLYFDERENRTYSFDGKVHITVQARETNVTQIVLHSNVDQIYGLSVLDNERRPISLNVWEPYTIEPQYHFLKINLGQPLQLNTNYMVVIDYSNTMNEGPMKRGIWKGWYTDSDGNERIYATTHFQPYNARQAFPCWDEPFFKAVFKLHLGVPLKYLATFSNTAYASIDMLENRRIRYNFGSTPRMSSYLLTFLASENFQVIAEDTSISPPVRIIGRSNTAGLADRALDLAVNMTKHFEEYFGIPYSTMDPNLLNDHIASPDWASAGTENWGMVSYRELYLILDKRETIMSVENYAATLISHELAHKWFGNLVTCNWWSNTWINEGFASYFGYLATYEVFPEYDHHELFNSRYLQTSLSFDSGTGTVPLKYEVNTPAQVTGHFGTISYSKGAAFLRMTADLITAETFRKACRYFLEDNKMEPADEYDLYNAFAKAIAEDNSLSGYSAFNFTAYYMIWVNEPGYPILNVDINHSSGEMAVSQERFFLSSTATPTGQIYPIPLTYSTKSNPDFDNVKPVHVLTGERGVLTKEDKREEWVIFNNLQHGHYRVNYDRRTWDLITDALLREPENIHHLNRAQVVDDIFALMRAGKMSYGTGFRRLRFLRNEVNYHVWNPAISGYTWLRNRLRHIPDKQAEFDSFVLSYLEKIIDSVGFNAITDEKPSVSLTRQEILHFACTIGHKKCIEESRNKFLAFRNNGTWVDPTIRRNVYVVGIREGGQEDFEFLLQQYRASNLANDKLEMLRALAATNDEGLLTRYLEMTLTKEVRPHDKVNSFNYALLGNPNNAKTVLQFVKNRIAEIRIAYIEDAPPNPVHTALSNLAAYLDKDSLNEYENWLRTTQSNSAQYNTALSAITSARNNIAWGENFADDLLKAARDGASAKVISISTVFILAIISLLGNNVQ